MNDIIRFFDRFIFYAKTLHLYEPLFISSVIIAAPLSTIIVNLLQNSAILILGNQNFTPLANKELIAFFILILLVYILRRSLTWLDTIVLNLLSRKQKYSIDLTKDVERFGREWLTQGNVYLDEGLVVTDTHSGILIRPKYLWLGKVWLNFEAKIVFSFQKKISLDTKQEYNTWVPIRDNELRQILGIIMRAQSLDNYYMLEVWKIDKEIVLKPHIRISGEWRAPIFNSPITHVLKHDQSEITIALKVKNRIASIYINGAKDPLIWVLPSDYEITSEKQKGDVKDGIVRGVPFKNRAGMIGFRNYGNEIAVVKSLSIEPLK